MTLKKRRNEEGWIGNVFILPCECAQGNSRTFL
uniref:Uncharacterized protein n=1 Tax=Anguilla anguilla TaxID=7936 RepID=A0A0E9RC36_ANGAN